MAIKNPLVKPISKERIIKLFELAEKEYGKSPKRADRYVALARKIAMRYNIRIQPIYKKRFCKKCYSYLVSGDNCTIRTNSVQKAVIITCKKCGFISRHPYRKELKRKRKE
ncbi:MAG: ribonuclease P protein component 4 [Candidatus Aenigmatarchaeota archaeon]